MSTKVLKINEAGFERAHRELIALRGQPIEDVTPEQIKKLAEKTPYETFCAEMKKGRPSDWCSGGG